MSTKASNGKKRKRTTVGSTSAVRHDLVDLAREDELLQLRASYARAGVDWIETCALDARGVAQLSAQKYARK